MLHLIAHTLKDTINLLPFLFVAFLVMEFIEVSAKTVDEALTEASITLGIPSSEIEALFG